MAGSTQDTQPNSFARRLAGIGFVILVQLVIFVTLLEVVARIIDPIGISYYNETARFFDEIVVEEPIGYRLRPGLSGRFNGVQVDVNERGMRDRAVSDTKPAGEFRILAMGDSVIFSVGVEADKTIPAQLERIANQAAPENRNYRVLNMGVPSYNTVQQLEQLRQVGQHLQPDAAFLFIVPNDMQDKMWVLSKRSNAIVDLSQRSYALGLGFYAGRSLMNLVSGPPASVAASLDQPGWQDIEKSLLQIYRILADRNVPLLVIYRGTFNAIYGDRLRALGEQHGFGVEKLDIWNDPRWSGLDWTDYVNSPVDLHCNAAGCEFYATLMYEFLQKHGLLDRSAPN